MPLVVLLMTAGTQVPVIPLVEVVGKSGAVAPEQIDTAVPKLKTGVVFGYTETEYVTGTAHWPGSGVNE